MIIKSWVMGASIRAFLILLLVANVRSGLLPGLPISGPNLSTGGILTGLGNVISTGLNTVETIGSDVLGSLTGITKEPQLQPTRLAGVVDNPRIDSSYATYLRDIQHDLDVGIQPITYTQWINKIHGDRYENPYHPGHGEPPKQLLPALTVQVDVSKTDKHKEDKEKNVLTVDKLPILGTDRPKLISPTHIDSIYFPGSEKILKVTKKEMTVPQISHTSAPVPGQHVSNQIATTLSSTNQLIGNLDVIPDVINSNNEGVGVPTPTVYKDNQGRIYYIIQPNLNPVIQPVQPTSSNTQGYTIMNVNGQQVLVPASTVTNPLQIDAYNIQPYPAQTVWYNPVTKAQTHKPNNVLSDISTAKYDGYEKQVMETLDDKNNGADITKGNSAVKDATDGPAWKDMVWVKDLEVDNIRK